MQMLFPSVWIMYVIFLSSVPLLFSTPMSASALAPSPLWIYILSSFWLGLYKNVLLRQRHPHFPSPHTHRFLCNTQYDRTEIAYVKYSYYPPMLLPSSCALILPSFQTLLSLPPPPPSSFILLPSQCLFPCKGISWLISLLWIGVLFFLCTRALKSSQILKLEIRLVSQTIRI